jgi:hypothetical protein
MPQLDKVTFLSQFFWLCVVFISLYLTLVKLFLPSFARIFKVRVALANASQESEGTETNESKAPQWDSAVYSKVLGLSMKAFENHTKFLMNWGTSQFTLLAPKITPNFAEKSKEICLETAVSATVLAKVTPPVTTKDVGNIKWTVAQARRLATLQMPELEYIEYRNVDGKFPLPRSSKGSTASVTAKTKSTIKASAQSPAKTGNKGAKGKKNKKASTKKAK